MSISDEANSGADVQPPARNSCRVDSFPLRRRLQPDAEADVTTRLEWLDDLMFAAIDGDPSALEAATDAWRSTLDELGAQTVEESRLQYLRRAQSVWNALRHQPNHPPHKVFAAIEVISLLAGRAW
jgi:hypothetical protein